MSLINQEKYFQLIFVSKSEILLKEEIKLTCSSFSKKADNFKKKN